MASLTLSLIFTEGTVDSPALYFGQTRSKLSAKYDDKVPIVGFARTEAIQEGIKLSNTVIVH